MVSVLASSVINHGFEPRSGQTKDYEIGICYFSAKHTALRRNSKDWLARNQDNVSEWSDMSIHGLLFQWANTIHQRLSRACIVQLVINRTNWSYVKTMSCGGSHLGITINIKNTKFVKDLPMIDAQFRFNQCNSFREEYISVFSPYGSVLILWPAVASILDFRSA